VVVPLAAPADTVTLADVPLEPFAIAADGKPTINVTSARVQFNSRSRNVPLDAGTGLLVLQGTLSADADPESLEFSDERDILVQRPDGVSVQPEFSAYKLLSAKDGLDFSIAFSLQQPVTGTYTFIVGFAGAIRHAIVVP
jgi:hypothetical protein